MLRPVFPQKSGQITSSKNTRCGSRLRVLCPEMSTKPIFTQLCRHEIIGSSVKSSMLYGRQRGMLLLSCGEVGQSHARSLLTVIFQAVMVGHPSHARINETEHLLD